MREFKKIPTILICIAMLLSAVTVLAADISSSGKCGDDLTWTLDNNGILTVSGTGEMNEHQLLVF